MRAQIAQAKHVSGQLQDAVCRYEGGTGRSLRVAVDADLELAQPDGSVTERFAGHRRGRAGSLRAQSRDRGRQPINSKRRARLCGRPAPNTYPTLARLRSTIYQDGAPFLSRNNGTVGLHMTWTMFEFGKRRGQVSERSAEIAQAEENLAHLKNRVRIDVEKAVRKLNRAETGVASAKELVAATTEARRVSSDQAEIGTANRSIFLESEASMLSAQADLLRAEYDRSVAAADLTRLTGNR